MRTRRWPVLVFGLGVLLVLGGLGWVTFHALRLERAEQEARAQARYQENIRLALWRMDSTITPILAREAARPYFEYQSFYPADKAFTRLLGQVAPGEVLVPSPLLQPPGEFVRLHFERAAGGIITSPQAPVDGMRALAESVYVSGYALSLAEQSLVQLSGLLEADARESDDALKEHGGAASAILDAAALARDEGLGVRLEEAPVELKKSSQAAQELQSASEYMSRSQNVDNAVRQQAAAVAQASQKAPLLAAVTSIDKPATTAAIAAAPEASPKDRSVAEKAENEARVDGAQREGRFAGWQAPPTASQPPALGAGKEPALVGAMDAGVKQREFAASWVGPPNAPELIYTREVEAAHAHLTQGFWLDWPGLRAALLASVQDLLPGASLAPMRTLPARGDLAVMGRSLAALPAELVMPPPVLRAAPPWSPVRTTLLATWIAAVGAAIAVAVVLRASFDLAERRGRFVSAVTHELRTPLTTFCLYSQMLDSGMVPTEEARRSYIRTLSTESQRLAAIVQSVLDYAHLGSARRRGPRAASPLGTLLERAIPPLRTRAEQAGMLLEVSAPAPAEADGALVRCEPAQLERILSNIIDNACKYGASADDRRINLDIGLSAQDLTITVRDLGPGIAPAEHRHISRAFFRGQEHTGSATPGLGLGLALAQEIAKDCGGDLRLTSPPGRGAEFRLRLPRG